MDKNKQQTISSGLYLVSTPIGNMEDITYRALNILRNSDFILCEDTRRSAKLLFYFKIKKKLLSFHKFNEKKVTGKIIDLIKKGKIISLISDAGTPIISDPGLTLVKACIGENLNVTPIPGASAVTAAISASGFSDKYIFYGFLSKKESEVDKVLKNFVNLDFSIVFFVPISKVNFYISKFKSYFQNRKIVLAKEMTKIHENFIRNDVEKIKNLPEAEKGEFTVVLSEIIKLKNVKKEINESVKVDIKKMLKKYSHKDVVEFISKRENLPKKIIYDFCLLVKK